MSDNSSKSTGFLFNRTVMLGVAAALMACSSAGEDEPTGTDSASLLKCVGKVCFENKGGRAIYQGDVDLGSLKEVESGSLKPRAFAAGRGVSQGEGDYLLQTVAWAAGNIRYTFANDVTDIDRGYVLAAMRRVSAAVPTIHFIDANSNPYYSNGDNDPPPVLYVVYSNDRGACFAQVGSHPTGGYMAIVPRSSGCIVHELGHVLGLWHEQSRPDRDNFVTINWENIEPGREQQFAMQGGLMSTPYDLHSVMHYPGWAFSRNGKPTITPKDPSVTLPYGYDLSPTDIEGLKLLYPTPTPAVPDIGGGS